MHQIRGVPYVVQQKLDEQMTEQFTAISFVSGKGGVGKTIMAINAACEISRCANVLLVDFDLFNFGLTLHFRKTLSSGATAGDRLLTLAELYASYDVNANWKHQIQQSILKQELASTRITPEGFKIFLLPCFIPNTDSQTRLTTALQPSSSPPRGPGDLAKLLDFAMTNISSRYQIDFVIFDCHPGMVGYSSPCCALSDCNVLVSDFDRSSLLSSVIFTALVERNLQSLPLGDLTKKPKRRNWRAVINRVPSCRQFCECSTRLDEAIWQAKNSDIEAFFRNLSPTMIQDFTAPLATIPDLEELRDYRLDVKKELSPARRGGNGLILATKQMLHNMAGCIESLRELPLIYSQDERMTAAFDALKSIYYLDRGLGRSGITRNMLVFALLDVVCAIWLLLGAVPVAAIIIETLLILLFGTALYEMARHNRLSRRCFDIFSSISRFDTQNYPMEQRHRLYNAGGSPATTSAIWFPKAVWFLCCSLGLAVAVSRGDLATGSMHFLVGLFQQHSDVAIAVIGVVSSIIGVIGVIFGNLTDTLSGIKKDVEFFVFSLLVAVGLIKGGELTEYY